MTEPLVITIDMDKKCIRCGKKGALGAERERLKNGTGNIS